MDKKREDTVKQLEALLSDLKKKEKKKKSNTLFSHIKRTGNVRAGFKDYVGSKNEESIKEHGRTSTVETVAGLFFNKDISSVLGKVFDKDVASPPTEANIPQQEESQEKQSPKTDASVSKSYMDHNFGKIYKSVMGLEKFLKTIKDDFKTSSQKIEKSVSNLSKDVDNKIINKTKTLLNDISLKLEKDLGKLDDSFSSSLSNVNHDMESILDKLNKLIKITESNTKKGGGSDHDSSKDELYDPLADEDDEKEDQMYHSVKKALEDIMRDNPDLLGNKSSDGGILGGVGNLIGSRAITAGAGELLGSAGAAIGGAGGLMSGALVAGAGAIGYGTGKLINKLGPNGNLGGWIGDKIYDMTHSDNSNTTESPKTVINNTTKNTTAQQKTQPLVIKPTQEKEEDAPDKKTPTSTAIKQKEIAPTEKPTSVSNDKADTNTTSLTPQPQQSQVTDTIFIANEPVIDGVPLSPKQMKMADMSMRMGNKLDPIVKKSYDLAIQRNQTATLAPNQQINNQSYVVDKNTNNIDKSSNQQSDNATNQTINQITNNTVLPTPQSGNKIVVANNENTLNKLIFHDSDLPYVAFNMG